MRIILHIISNNYTNLKQKIINFDETRLNIKNIIDYLYKYNIIDTTDYTIYHNNMEIEDIINISDNKEISLVLKQNKFCNKSSNICSCKYNCDISEISKILSKL